MRLLVVGVAVLLCGCLDPCRRLGDGSSTAGLSLTPSTRRPHQMHPGFSYGDAEAYWCCARLRAGEAPAGCDAARFNCSDPMYDGMEIMAVGEPYSGEGVWCTVAVKDETIFAVWGDGE